MIDIKTNCLIFRRSSTPTIYHSCCGGIITHCGASTTTALTIIVIIIASDSGGGGQRCRCRVRPRVALVLGVCCQVELVEAFEGGGIGAVHAVVGVLLIVLAHMQLEHPQVISAKGTATFRALVLGVPLRVPGKVVLKGPLVGRREVAVWAREGLLFGVFGGEVPLKEALPRACVGAMRTRVGLLPRVLLHMLSEASNVRSYIITVLALVHALPSVLGDVLLHVLLVDCHKWAVRALQPVLLLHSRHLSLQVLGVVLADHVPLECTKVGRVKGAMRASMQALASVPSNMVGQGLLVKGGKITLVAGELLLHLVFGVGGVGGAGRGAALRNGGVGAGLGRLA